jgi:hypothetical protein
VFLVFQRGVTGNYAGAVTSTFMAMEESGSVAVIVIVILVRIEWIRSNSGSGSGSSSVSIDIEAAMVLHFHAIQCGRLKLDEARTHGGVLYLGPPRPDPPLARR